MFSASQAESNSFSFSIFCNEDQQTIRLLPQSVMSHDDVIQSADPAEPVTQCLSDSCIGHVTGKLAEAGVERWLKRQEGGVRQEEDLVEKSQDHVGPRLQRETV
ncbi:hypothetical protein XENOCAPTIV_027452 [Xenoophorus captivus]|uniref:Uncharacterized protein n=1 Tax=Xenoophorus captivus TaxID=1517983 RepID=A0ABV0RMD6_9TELE